MIRSLILLLLAGSLSAECKFALIEYVSPTTVVSPEQVTPDTMTKSAVSGCVTAAEDFVAVVISLENGKPKQVLVIPIASVTSITPLTTAPSVEIKPQELPAPPVEKTHDRRLM